MGLFLLGCHQELSLTTAFQSSVSQVSRPNNRLYTRSGIHSPWKTPLQTPPSLIRTPNGGIKKTTTTHLSMYNLPPGGGGGGGKNNAMTQILQGALTVGAIVLFFASPLGSIFFAITNSLFLLALITPVILTIAFQVWQSLNTIQGTCPNCGAPNQRVLKDPSQVSFCFNCGAFLQASQDGKTIELSAPARNRGGGDFIDMDQQQQQPMGGSIFDQLFGGGGGMGGGEPQQPSASSVSDKEKKFRREQTVIDVEVQKKDDD